MKTLKNKVKSRKVLKADISTISPDKIPTLISKKLQDILFQGDDTPFLIAEEIKDISQKANGVYFSIDFWKSYIGKMKNRVIPGSRTGHLSGFESYYKRANSDVYTIGGFIDEKKNKVYLKVYIPKMGEIETNDGLIRDAKLNNINFSIVAYTRDEYIREGEGFKIIAKESIKGERNDVVEFGLGAMDQNNKRLNKAGRQLNSSGMSNAKAIIKAGDINTSSRWSWSSSDGNSLLGENGDNWNNYKKWFLAENTNATEETKSRYNYPFGKNGKVYRSALIAIRQRASQQKDTSIYDAAGTLIELIDSKSEKEYIMKENVYQDIIKNLKNQITNGTVSKNEIAKDLSIDFVEEKHISSTKSIEELKKMFGDDFINKIKQLKDDEEKTKKERYELLRNKKMTENFGPEKIGESDNLKRNAAEPLISHEIQDKKNLDEQIEAAKKNPVVCSFAFDEADYTSSQNDISGVVSTKNVDAMAKYKANIVEE